MRIDKAIQRADELLNNNYSENLKIDWLSELDERVLREVFATHEGLCNVVTAIDVKNMMNAFNPLYKSFGVEETGSVTDVTAPWVFYLKNEFDPLYKSLGKSINSFEKSDLKESELLIPSRYNEVYIFYLLYKYAFFNGEFDRASYYASEYTGLYTEFVNYINRNYRPITKVTIKEGLPWQ